MPKADPKQNLGNQQEPIVQVPDNPQPGVKPGDEQPDVIGEALKAAGLLGKTEKAEKEKPEEKPEPVEAKPAKADEPKSEDGPVAKGWAAIKQSERKLMSEREAMKAERHQLAKMKEEIEELKRSQAASSSSLKESFKKDALGTLRNEFGLSFNDLAKLALSSDERPVIEAPREDPEKKALADRLDRMERLLQNQSVEKKLESYRADIRSAVQSDELAILNTLPNLESEVLTLAGNYYQKTGEQLSADKACGILATYWEKHLKSLTSHAAARRALGLPEQDGAPTKPAPRANGPKKTLTNTMSSSPRSPGKLPDNMSPHEELLAAAKLVPDDAWSDLD